MKKIDQKVSWKDITPGGTTWAPGNAEEFITGDWRTERPVWDQEKCKQCLLCTPACPDCSIPVEGKKRVEFDYDHCKGCGICVNVCPFGAITMVKEGK